MERKRNPGTVFPRMALPRIALRSIRATEFSFLLAPAIRFFGWRGRPRPAKPVE